MTIPVLTTYNAHCFMKYFAGVEQILSQRFLLGYAPDEEHLTSILCELLDAKGSALHALPYTLAQLNCDLGKNSGLLEAAIEIATAKYNRYEEHHKTQSDFGIIVRYVDNIDPSESFERGVLVQAKRLYPDQNGSYSLESAYGGFDAAQYARLQLIEEKFGSGCEFRLCHYLLFNPPSLSLSGPERSKISYEQLRWIGRMDPYLFGMRRRGGFDLAQFSDEPRDNWHALGTSAVFLPLNTMHNLTTIKAATGGARIRNFRYADVVNNSDILSGAMPCFMMNLIDPRSFGGVGCSNKNVLRFISGETPTEDGFNEISLPRLSITFTITAGRAQTERIDHNES